jgi:hypothetical protein
MFSTDEQVSLLSSGQAHSSIHSRWALDDITKRCPSFQNQSKEEKLIFSWPLEKALACLFDELQTVRQDLVRKGEYIC